MVGNDVKARWLLAGWEPHKHCEELSKIIAGSVAKEDNDGTLWAEQPQYVPLAYNGPGSGTTTQAYSDDAAYWVDATKHPSDRFSTLSYKDMTYKPMVQMLEYLRSKGIKTYIVSGGDVDFMRGWTWSAYEIQSEQVIGSYPKSCVPTNEPGQPSQGASFSVIRVSPTDEASLCRGAANKSSKKGLFGFFKSSEEPAEVMEARLMQESAFLDDKVGKAVAIDRRIGRRPVLSFGNSDGDLAMHQWVESGGNGLSAYIRHTDADREWQYDDFDASNGDECLPKPSGDRDPNACYDDVGALNTGYDYAYSDAEHEKLKSNWAVVDMASEWTCVFDNNPGTGDVCDSGA